MRRPLTYKERVKVSINLLFGLVYVEIRKKESPIYRESSVVPSGGPGKIDNKVTCIQNFERKNFEQKKLVTRISKRKRKKRDVDERSKVNPFLKSIGLIVLNYLMNRLQVIDTILNLF